MLHPQAKGLNWVDGVKGGHKYVIDELFFAVLPGRKSKGVGEIINLINVVRAHAAEMNRRIFGAKHKVSRRCGRIGMKPAPDHQGRKVRAVVSVQVAKSHVSITRVLDFLQGRKCSRT